MTTETYVIHIPWATQAFDRDRRGDTSRCRTCDRKMPHRKDGNRVKHRTEADNPLAPYCPGDSS